MLRHIEDQTSFAVGNLVRGDGGLITGCFQPAFAFPAALPRVAQSKVELLQLVEIFGGEIARREQRKELGIPGQDRIGTDPGRDLLRLTLLDLGASGFQSMIVRDRQVYCLIEVNGGRLLREPGWGGKNQQRKT